MNDTISLDEKSADAFHSKFRITPATLADAAAIGQLIELSARGLSQSDYSSEQIEGALGSAWGLDTQLIHDGTYYTIWYQTQMVGCGGWSFRQTLFGSDARKERDSAVLDPAADAAKIRAFFIHPDFARQGLGSMLLAYCEQAAAGKGFRRLELGVTLPGYRLYTRHGYSAGEAYEYATTPQASITIIPMFKALPNTRDE